MASENSTLGPITSLDTPWKGHTHYEVEQFIKDQLEELGSATVRSKISLAIEGNSIRSFLNGSANETFRYKVTYTRDNAEQSSCKYKILIGNRVVEEGDSVAGIVTTSPNIAKYLNQISDPTVYVTLRVYDVDEEGNENPTTSARITYNRKTASLVCSTQLGAVNPDVIQFTTTFNAGDTANLFVEYYDANGVELQASTKRTLQQRGQVSTSVPTNLSAGAHVVKAYLVLNDDNDEDDTTGTRGAEVSTTIVSTNGAQQGDIFIIVGGVRSAVVNDYTDIQFMAYVVGAESATIPVAMQELASGAYTTKAIRRVSNGALQTWHYLVKSDITTLRIGVPDTKADGSLDYSAQGTLKFSLEPVVFTFEAAASSITWSTPLGSDAYFTMQNKTNNDYDIGVLKSGNYSATFDDVQFNSNGSGYSDIEINGNISTALHLVGTSKVTLGNLYPFYDATPQGNMQGGGILAKGRTLKMSFMVSNVSNPDERVIDCYDEATNTGFYVTGNAIYINLGKELVSLPYESQAKAGHNARRFCANTKMDLTIVVQPYYAGGAETKHELRYFINGEIAGFAVLKDSELDLLSLSQSRAIPLTFGGKGAILDLFDVRYYEKALSSFEVLQMRTMDLDNSLEIASIFNKNNYYDTDEQGNPIITLAQAINYGKYLASTGKFGFAVFASTNLCNGEEYIGNTSTHSTRPEGFYIFRFKQDENGEGIIDADNTIFVEALGIDLDNKESYLRVRRQGTSTASSTKGNIRLDVRGNCRIHKWNPSTNKFWEYSGADDENCYTVKKKAAIWHIPDANAIPCTLLTCKKNPNESTQARNLPTAKWYEDSCRYLATLATGTDEEGHTIYGYEDCLTMPQRRELDSIVANRADLNSRTQQINAIKTRQCVDGIPSLGFEIAYADTSLMLDPLSNVSTFGGQFDMITDKSNMDVFGFGGWNEQDASGKVTWKKHANDRDYSIEWRRNASPICNFLSADLSLLNGRNTEEFPNEFAKDLEHRYPDVGVAIAESNTIGATPTIGMGKTEGIQRLFDLVRTCALDKDDIDPEGSYFVAGERLAYTKPGMIPIGETYLGEANGNINAFEWKQDNATNRLAKFKAEAKNYFVVNQILFNGIAILAALMCDQDTKNQFFTHCTGEETAEGHDLLRLLGYDFDSSWGIDNDNFFRFLDTVLYEDNLYDGSAIDPVTNEYKGPMFWKLVFRAFTTEMYTIAGHLYDGFLNKAAVLNYMQENQVDIYNALQYNANSEYSYTSSASDYLKTHGSAKEHTEWFVEGRMYFISGRWGRGTSNEPGGDYAKGVANFNLALFNDAFAQAYPFNTANRGKDKWALRVQGYKRTTVQLRDGASTFCPKVNVDVDTEYDENFLPTRVISPEAIVQAYETTGTAAGDNRLAIYGGKHLRSVKGLANWYIASVMDWGDLINVEELEIGSTANLSGDDENPEYYRNPNLVALSISKTFGSCKKLNLAGCPSLQGILSLTAFPVLEDFEGIRMDGITAITLPISNSLKTISYPKNLTSWTMDNKPNVSSIKFEGFDNLTEISVTNSSEYAAQEAINVLERLM